MLMTEIRAPDAASVARGGLERRAIMLVAQPGLLMECLVEILRRRFSENQVTVFSDLAHFPSAISGEAPLVLFYHQDPPQTDVLIRQLKQLESGISIGIIIDDHEDSDQNLRDLASGQQIDGVLPLNLRLDVFLAAVDLLAKGGEHFPSALLQHLSANGAGYGRPAKLRIDPPSHPSRTDRDNYILTTREVEILDLVCKGTQNKIIAGRLKLSENTVKVHIRNIYKKMHVRNRTEAASRYFDYDGRAAASRQAAL